MFDLNFGNLLALACAFVGALWALIKIIATQQEKSLGRRFEDLSENIKGVNESLSENIKGVNESLSKSITGVNQVIQEEQKTTQRLERELLQFKAELPRDYVRREDFIRAVGTIETKIDNMALRVERAVLNNGQHRSDL